MRDSSLGARPCTGPEWTAYRRQLFRGPFAGKPCAACGHEIRPGLGEIQHQLSVRTHPEHAWTVTVLGSPNLVPVHGGGARRCPDPVCRLACNSILAGNAAPRDEDGRPVLPFPPDFLAAKVAERQAYRARPAPSARKPRQTPGNPGRDRPAARAAPEPRVWPDAGRAW